MALEDLTGHSIAYVVNNAGATNASQNVFLNRLISAGASATYVTAGGAGFATIVAPTYTGWVIDESPGSATVGTNLSSSTLPGMHGKLFAWDSHNLCGAGEAVDAAETSINIINDTHYIITNAGQSLGTVAILASQQFQQTTLANLAAGVTPLATIVGQPTQALLGAIDAGGALVGGGSAAARRAMWGCWSNNPSTPTAAGFALWDACINWMLGFDGGGSPQNVTADPADYSWATDGITINQGALANPADYSWAMSFVIINGDDGSGGGFGHSQDRKKLHRITRRTLR